MKLAILTASISRNAGGLFQSVRYSSQELARTGNVLTVCSTRDQFSTDDIDVWAPLLPLVFPHIGPQALSWAPGMLKHLRQSSPDLVHVHGIWQGPSIASLLYHLKCRRPFLVSPRGMLDPWALARSHWKKRICSALFEHHHLLRARCLHALCNPEARSFRAYGLTNPIAIIPNGVDLPMTHAGSLKVNEKILLFLGRVHPKKGLVNALKAWDQIRNQASRVNCADEWKFVIAGWDQNGHESELKQLCRELGLRYIDRQHHELFDDILKETRPVNEVRCDVISPDVASHPSSVVFVGPTFGGQKDQLLRAASAFILPSFSEGLPMSVLEAWAYRLPVLMTDHCNLPEGFAAGAAVCIGTDVKSIADGLHQMISATNLQRRLMGDCGRDLVERQFTWPQVAAQMKEVYDWVLGGGAKPSCVE
jgi:glycosyltransferase involved in cell wall biosynthesis